ncbi:hypothetical protein FACS1894103_0300 [Campylobacterota bacterium]|nr:hypothetical protein FACS1894103_0300 [Campylobacterota bacterium]
MTNGIRSGFSMIEIIVTILLLGLIFATVPMLLESANQSDADSLEGEALYHAAALLNRITAMPYNSALLDGNESRILDVIDGAGTSKCNDNINGRKVRAGTKVINPPQFRSCTDAPKVSHGQSNPDEKRAINHFDGYTQDLVDRGFTLKVTIDNFDPTPSSIWTDYPVAPKGAPVTHMMLITVEAVRTDTDTTIGTLRYVASNIGAPQ